jgi:hypothetical protein
MRKKFSFPKISRLRLAEMEKEALLLSRHDILPKKKSEKLAREREKVIESRMGEKSR